MANKQKLRIAYGRIFHEGNSYSPLLTEKEAFTEFHYARGKELETISHTRQHELVGVLRRAELTGFVDAAKEQGNIEVVPLSSALAVPGGNISPECFAWLREQLTDELKAMGDVDGVYLALHGSMRVEGLDEAPEAVLIRDVRAIIGDKGLAVSYDLHANLTPGIVDTTTILEGYRTNPHRDLYKTGERAGTQLIKTLRGEYTPTRAWRKLPVILGGGMTIDFLNPMRPIFRHIKKLCRRPDVISGHVFMVHPYTSAEDLGWAVHVATNGDQALADRLADELAEMVWNVRKVPLPEFRTPSQAVGDLRSARLARATGQVSLVDTADIVGAGSTGGNTHLLDALVNEGQDLTVFIPLHDPLAVEEMWKHREGDTISVTLKGTPGLDEQPEVEVSGRLARRIETDFGRTLLLEAGELRIAITEKPPGAIHPKFWKELGLSAWKADAIVQKFFFHYRIFYAATVRKNIPVKSAGPSSLDNVRSRNFELPVYPQNQVEEWRSFDQERRIKAAEALQLQ